MLIHRGRRRKRTRRRREGEGTEKGKALLRTYISEQPEPGRVGSELKNFLCGDGRKVVEEETGERKATRDSTPRPDPNLA